MEMGLVVLLGHEEFRQSVGEGTEFRCTSPIPFQSAWEIGTKTCEVPGGWLPLHSNPLERQLRGTAGGCARQLRNESARLKRES